MTEKSHHGVTPARTQTHGPDLRLGRKFTCDCNPALPRMTSTGHGSLHFASRSLDSLSHLLHALHDEDDDTLLNLMRTEEELEGLSKMDEDTMAELNTDHFSDRSLGHHLNMLGGNNQPSDSLSVAEVSVRSEGDEPVGGGSMSRSIFSVGDETELEVTGMVHQGIKRSFNQPHQGKRHTSGLMSRHEQFARDEVCRWNTMEQPQCSSIHAPSPPPFARHSPRLSRKSPASSKDTVPPAPPFARHSPMPSQQIHASTPSTATSGKNPAALGQSCEHYVLDKRSLGESLVGPSDAIPNNPKLEQSTRSPPLSREHSVLGCRVPQNSRTSPSLPRISQRSRLGEAFRVANSTYMPGYVPGQVRVPDGEDTNFSIVSPITSPSFRQQTPIVTATPVVEGEIDPGEGRSDDFAKYSCCWIYVCSRYINLAYVLASFVMLGCIIVAVAATLVFISGSNRANQSLHASEKKSPGVTTVFSTPSHNPTNHPSASPSAAPLFSPSGRPSHNPTVSHTYPPITTYVGPLLRISVNNESVPLGKPSHYGSNYKNFEDKTGGKGRPVHIAPDGSKISLFGNTWKALPFQYDIQWNTVLEFDLRIAEETEIQAICLDSDLYSERDPNTDGSVVDRCFQLAGTSVSANWVNRLATPAINHKHHFRIKAGQYFTGKVYYLGFVSNSDEDPSLGKAFFSKIAIYNDDVMDVAKMNATEISNTGSMAYDVGLSTGELLIMTALTFTLVLAAYAGVKVYLGNSCAGK